MVQDGLEKMMEEFCDEDGDIYNDDRLEESVEMYFKSIGVKFVANTEEMFDNPGIDIHSYSIAWEESGKLNMITYRICNC